MKPIELYYTYPENYEINMIQKVVFPDGTVILKNGNYINLQQCLKFIGHEVKCFFPDGDFFYENPLTQFTLTNVTLDKTNTLKIGQPVYCLTGNRSIHLVDHFAKEVIHPV